MTKRLLLSLLIFSQPSAASWAGCLLSTTIKDKLALADFSTATPYSFVDPLNSSFSSLESSKDGDNLSVLDIKISLSKREKGICDGIQKFVWQVSHTKLETIKAVEQVVATLQSLSTDVLTPEVMPPMMYTGTIASYLFLFFLNQIKQELEKLKIVCTDKKSAKSEVPFQKINKLLTAINQILQLLAACNDYDFYVFGILFELIAFGSIKNCLDSNRKVAFYSAAFNYTKENGGFLLLLDLVSMVDNIIMGEEISQQYLKTSSYFWLKLASVKSSPFALDIYNLLIQKGKSLTKTKAFTKLDSTGEASLLASLSLAEIFACLRSTLEKELMPQRRDMFIARFEKALTPNPGV